MTAEVVPTGLHAKLAAIAADAERIPKRGKAPAEMGGFPFVQVGDAADFIRKALGERGVSMLPSQVEVIAQNEHEGTSAKGAPFVNTTLDIRVTWTLTDAETGETAVIQSIGAGADRGDKYTGKAMSNAMKYALLMGFLLSTGDDPELSNSEERGSKSGSEERLTMLGRIKGQTGIVAKGDGLHSNLAVRQTQNPDGMVFGFRLEKIGGKPDKHIAQVVVDGPLGDAYVTAFGDPAELVGKKVTVGGLLYSVRVAGRRETHRLLVESIAGDDWTLPASEETAGDVGEAASPPEAPSEPLPGFDMEAVDREAGLAEALAS